MECQTWKCITSLSRYRLIFKNNTSIRCYIFHSCKSLSVKDFFFSLQPFQTHIPMNHSMNSSGLCCLHWCRPGGWCELCFCQVFHWAIPLTAAWIWWSNWPTQQLWLKYLPKVKGKWKGFWDILILREFWILHFAVLRFIFIVVLLCLNDLLFR